MEQHELEIEIRKNGEVKVHVRGAKGKSCLTYAELLKQVVGEVKEQQYTHEYYEPEGKVRVDAAAEQRVKQAEA